MGTKDTKPKEVEVTPEEMEKIKKLKRQFTILEHNEQEKKRIRNKRDTITNSILLSINLLIVIVSVIVGAWVGLITILVYTLWLLIVWMLERQISDQRYIINMQFGLNKIRVAVYEDALKDTLKEKK